MKNIFLFKKPKKIAKNKVQRQELEILPKFRSQGGVCLTPALFASGLHTKVNSSQ